MLLEDSGGYGERRVRLPIISGSSFGFSPLERSGVTFVSAGLSPFSISGVLNLNDCNCDIHPSRVDSSFHASSNRFDNF